MAPYHSGNQDELKYLKPDSLQLCLLSFVTGKDHQGRQVDTNLEGESYNIGFLAFLHLIGTETYKRHTTGFDILLVLTHQHQQISFFYVFWCPYHYTTATQDMAGRHTANCYRSKHIQYDTELIPSNEAVYYHWKRSCWVIRGSKETRTKWSSSQSLTMAGHSVTTNWLFCGIHQRTWKQFVKEFIYF